MARMDVSESRTFLDGITDITKQGSHPAPGDALFPSFLVAHSLFRSQLRQGYPVRQADVRHLG